MAGGALLQSGAASTGVGNSINCQGILGTYTLEIETSDATVSAGGVTFETSPRSTFAGTWAALAAEVTPVRNAIVQVRVTGSFAWIRARVSTAVTGGATVTCRVLIPNPQW